MNLPILCALIALLPATLLAADTITVEATFAKASSRRAIPHDLKKLSATKGIDIVASPRVITRSGQSAEIAITRDFHVRSVAPGKHPLVPTGIILRITPSVTSNGIAYRAHITLREHESLTGPVATFVSREIYASGTPNAGEEVWLDLPNRDGKATVVRLVFQRNDA
jgi:hypothetical protein